MTLRLGILAIAVLSASLGTAATATPLSDNSYPARVHTAPPPAVPHVTYDIVVDNRGNKVRGSAGTGAFTGGTGSAIATFPVDVTACVFVGSLARAVKNGGTAEPGGDITVVRSSGFPNGVFVQTFGPRGVLRNRPFHLLVAC